MENTKYTSSRESKWCWTNEKHLRFLNSIEASFVRGMLGNKHYFHRLDRVLPDISESTQDLPNERQRRRRYSSSDIIDTSGRTNEATRRSSFELINSIPDQVVPQLINRKNDTTEEDHGEHGKMTHFDAPQ